MKIAVFHELNAKRRKPEVADFIYLYLHTFTLTLYLLCAVSSVRPHTADGSVGTHKLGHPADHIKGVATFSLWTCKNLSEQS